MIVAQFLAKLVSSLGWEDILMGAPPIHHLSIRVNDSLSSEINQAEKGVMNQGHNENPLKVRNKLGLI